MDIIAMNAFIGFMRDMTKIPVRRPSSQASKSHAGEAESDSDDVAWLALKVFKGFHRPSRATQEVPVSGTTLNDQAHTPRQLVQSPARPLGLQQDRDGVLTGSFSTTFSKGDLGLNSGGGERSLEGKSRSMMPRLQQNTMLPAKDVAVAAQGMQAGVSRNSPMSGSPKPHVHNMASQGVGDAVRYTRRTSTPNLPSLPQPSTGKAGKSVAQRAERAKRHSLQISAYHVKNTPLVNDHSIIGTQHGQAKQMYNEPDLLKEPVAGQESVQQNVRRFSGSSINQPGWQDQNTDSPQDTEPSVPIQQSMRSAHVLKRWQEVQPGFAAAMQGSRRPKNASTGAQTSVLHTHNGATKAEIGQQSMSMISSSCQQGMQAPIASPSGFCNRTTPGNVRSSVQLWEYGTSLEPTGSRENKKVMSHCQSIQYHNQHGATVLGASSIEAKQNAASISNSPELDIIMRMYCPKHDNASLGNVIISQRKEPALAKGEIASEVEISAMLEERAKVAPLAAGDRTVQHEMQLYLRAPFEHNTIDAAAGEIR